MRDEPVYHIEPEALATRGFVRNAGAGPARDCRAQAAYTLLEICLTMVVVAVMVGATLPLTQGLVSEERLRALGNDLADFASTARKLAVREGRTFVVKFAENRVSLGPWRGEGVEFEETLALQLPRNASVVVRHEETEKWRNELVWFFQPGGLADPLQMKLQEGPSWSVRVFNPLTALSREEASHSQ
jgi:hypothetical protein